MVVLVLALLSTGCTVLVDGTPSAAPGAAPEVEWDVVRAPKRAAAYDVPPTWTVRTESTVIGYRDAQGNPVASSGAATYGEGRCGEYSNLAIAVVRHDEGTDLAAAARVNAELWAGAAYLDAADTPPALSTGPPETIRTAAGQQAVVVEVTATPATPNPTCGTTTGAVYAVAAGGYAGELGPTAVLVVVADVDAPGAAPESDIRRMLSSLRPLT